MKRAAVLLALVSVLFSCASMHRTSSRGTDGYDVYLLIGQSNMAGRGDFGEVPEIVNDKCFMLRNGKWVIMSEPINPDRQIFGYFHSGVGLAASFADAYANRFHESVGLIPCADGGTALKEWMPGTQLYKNAVAQGRLASDISEISGILWHQGENDSRSEEDVQNYRPKFLTMITALKKDLSLRDDIPILIGGLGDFVASFDNGSLKYSERINGVLKALCDELPFARFVSAEGLVCKYDGIHFDSKSYREFGKRYFSALCELYDGKKGS